MKYIKHLSLIVGVALTMFSCENRPEKVTLKVIQTTDIHGCIFPYDFIKQKEVNNSLANIYSYVQKQRAAYSNLILLDNGDYLQGQPTVYYYNFQDTASAHIGASVFNFMQYDATTVGNHDIEAGHAVYDRFNQALDMPYLAANAINTGAGEPYFKPYTIIEKGGIRVAVLGLITPGIPHWLPNELWHGIEFQDMIETAQKWMPIIQNEKPDLIIGMFHAGVDHTYGNPEGSTYLNENATKLVAQQVPGFDIVLAGHDHQYDNEKVVNTAGDTVLLLDPKSHGRAVADITVDFTWDEQNKKYQKKINGEVVDTQNEPADSSFMAHFAPQYAAVKAYVNKKVGYIKNNIDSKSAYFGPNPFMNLIHQVQRDIAEAQVSFASPLTYVTSIPEGDLLVSDMFKLYKYENMLYTMELSGEEIDAFLEYSYSHWFTTMQTSNDHLLQLKEDDHGQYRLANNYYNLASAGGLNYTVDVKKARGNQVSIQSFSNGKAFYADSVYTVAVNSYRGNGGGGHLTQGVGLSKEEINSRLIRSTDKDIRYYMMQWIEAHDTIEAPQTENWQVVPQVYFDKGKEKDWKLLFE